ncbi:MAG: DUF1565 domain-containing protein [Planctomycetes bacterium]|nr:DUF1565 domain-containing protein [Planctomycetota bacterium]
MDRLNRSIFMVLGIVALTACAQAATYYVAPGAPNASDENPGSEEQPWKTLTHACQTVTAGDTVWVKAGVYRETLEPRRDQVTFQAFADDLVTIALPEGRVISPAAWSKVPDRPKVYQCQADTEGQMVRVDGLALQFEQVQGVQVTTDPGSGQKLHHAVARKFEDTDFRRWTRLDGGILQINLGGEDPARHRVEMGTATFAGIRLTTKEGRVRGFQIEDVEVGISMGGERNIVEDCVVRGADAGASLRGWANILRRCALLRCWQGINTGDCPGAHVMEENFIIGTGHPFLRNRSPQTNLHAPWGPCSVRYGNVNFCVCCPQPSLPAHRPDSLERRSPGILAIPDPLRGRANHGSGSGPRRRISSLPPELLCFGGAAPGSGRNRKMPCYRSLPALGQSPTSGRGAVGRLLFNGCRAGRPVGDHRRNLRGKISSKSI